MGGYARCCSSRSHGHPIACQKFVLGQIKWPDSPVAPLGNTLCYILTIMPREVKIRAIWNKNGYCIAFLMTKILEYGKYLIFFYGHARIHGAAQAAFGAMALCAKSRDSFERIKTMACPCRESLGRDILGETKTQLLVVSACAVSTPSEYWVTEFRRSILGNILRKDSFVAESRLNLVMELRR